MKNYTMKKKSGWLKPVEALTTPFFSLFFIKQNPVVNPAKIHKKHHFFNFFFTKPKNFTPCRMIQYCLQTCSIMFGKCFLIILDIYKNNKSKSKTHQIAPFCQKNNIFPKTTFHLSHISCTTNVVPL